ncbi:MAG TPA: nickel pincer cofactor biosynthesis protein LarC [Pilimelia sp.]|nr:nickel pincer cofactor biosynthesis protein LarC [Pilimelia sp.]
MLWVDPGNGAAGDMLLAALLDAGASVDAVRAGLGRLSVEPITLEVSQARRHGFRATRVEVRTAAAPAHRGLAQIVEIIDTAGLPEAVRTFAGAAFARLAEAESRVHGVSVAEVHFHEVGGLDAIADIVGCGLGLHSLGLLDGATRVVGPVAVGSGAGRSSHGRLPLPAPAVLELLTAAGAPIAAHPAPLELCTPTGAALLVTLATGWGPPPSLTPRLVGVGAGTRDPDSHPNVLRVLIGDGQPAVADWSVADLYQVESTVDDLDPRVWPDLLAQLRAAGAADAWCTPALMRKGRPGQVLSVLVDADQLDVICRVVFTQTTTLGVRVGRVQRRALRRDEVRVTVAGQPVGVKRGFLGDRLVTAQPEYDDARLVAERTGLPVVEVINRARAAAADD